MSSWRLQFKVSRLNRLADSCVKTLLGLRRVGLAIEAVPSLVVRNVCEKLPAGGALPFLFVRFGCLMPVSSNMRTHALIGLDLVSTRSTTIEDAFPFSTPIEMLEVHLPLMIGCV